MARVVTGRAATLVARRLERHPWRAWIGLTIILYVALTMIWHGACEVEAAVM